MSKIHEAADVQFSTLLVSWWRSAGHQSTAGIALDVVRQWLFYIIPRLFRELGLRPSHPNPQCQFRFILGVSLYNRQASDLSCAQQNFLGSVFGPL